MSQSTQYSTGCSEPATKEDLAAVLAALASVEALLKISTDQTQKQFNAIFSEIHKLQSSSSVPGDSAYAPRPPESNLTSTNSESSAPDFVISDTTIEPTKKSTSLDTSVSRPDSAETHINIGCAEGEVAKAASDTRASAGVTYNAGHLRIGGTTGVEDDDTSDQVCDSSPLSSTTTIKNTTTPSTTSLLKDLPHHLRPYKVSFNRAGDSFVDLEDLEEADTEEASQAQRALEDIQNQDPTITGTDLSQLIDMFPNLTFETFNSPTIPGIVSPSLLRGCYSSTETTTPEDQLVSGLSQGPNATTVAPTPEDLTTSSSAVMSDRRIGSSGSQTFGEIQEMMPNSPCLETSGTAEQHRSSVNQKKRKRNTTANEGLATKRFRRNDLVISDETTQSTAVTAQANLKPTPLHDDFIPYDERLQSIQRLVDAAIPTRDTMTTEEKRVLEDEVIYKQVIIREYSSASMAKNAPSKTAEQRVTHYHDLIEKILKSFGSVGHWKRCAHSTETTQNPQPPASSAGVRSRTRNSGRTRPRNRDRGIRIIKEVRKRSQRSRVTTANLASSQALTDLLADAFQVLNVD